MEPMGRPWPEIFKQLSQNVCRSADRARRALARRDLATHPFSCFLGEFLG